MSFGSSYRTLSLLIVMSGYVAVGGTGRAATTDPLDWPNWRGPQQNRVSTEKGLVENWRSRRRRREQRALEEEGVRRPFARRS